MAAEFIGKGWGFPMSTTSNGEIALVSGDREIREAIRLILSTSFGERPMRPNFGCGIHDHVFDPANATTAGIISYEVKRALTQWEPRINVSDVNVLLDKANEATLYINVIYAIRGTNDARNLVFPFYVIPQEG